jgi:hypothetical protein
MGKKFIKFVRKRLGKMKKDLTTIEWNIYEFLKVRSEKGLWTNRNQIIEWLQEENNQTLSLRNLRKHINKIRNCDLIQKVLLISSAKDRGYKFYTNEKDYEILYKEKIKILKELKTWYKNYQRLSSNNQMKFTFKPYEREYIQSILKEKH